MGKENSEGKYFSSISFLRRHTRKDAVRCQMQ